MPQGGNVLSKLSSGKGGKNVYELYQLVSKVANLQFIGHQLISNVCLCVCVLVCLHYKSRDFVRLFTAKTVPVAKAPRQSSAYLFCEPEVTKCMLAKVC
jgi:hypothetical protein